MSLHRIAVALQGLLIASSAPDGAVAEFADGSRIPETIISSEPAADLALRTGELVELRTPLET